MNQNEIRGNLDTGLLKIIALVCMIIDHAGVRLLGNATEWRLIGRIAFPLYLWCMVVGACYTHSPARYALRLLAVGLISQPCFMLGLNHGWNQLNVFFTLLLGYLGIWGIRENRYGRLGAAAGAGCALLCQHGLRLARGAAGHAAVRSAQESRCGCGGYGGLLPVLGARHARGAGCIWAQPARRAV